MTSPRVDLREAFLPPRLPLVTTRQHEALYWRSLGLTVTQMAREMRVTENTVKELLRKLHRNLDVVSGPEAIRVGFETGLLAPRPRRFTGSVHDHLEVLRIAALKNHAVRRCVVERPATDPEPCD